MMRLKRRALRIAGQTRSFDSIGTFSPTHPTYPQTTPSVIRTNTATRSQDIRGEPSGDTGWQMFDLEPCVV